MHQLDIIIPVKNESENLPELLGRIDNSLTSAGITYGIIVVDDHSTDSSVKILKQLSCKYPLEVLIKKGKPGKAYSIIEGAALAQSEYVAMIDGDLQYPPEALPEMFALTKEHGVVVANRKTHHTSSIRKFVSKMNRLFFGRFLLGISADVQSGLKLFKRDLFSYLDLKKITPWALDMPLLHTAKELGYSIGTVDIDFSDRKNGSSKLHLLSATSQIGLTALRLKFSPSAVYRLLPENNAIHGSGIIHRKKTYITHSQLHPSYSAIITLLPWQKLFIVSLITPLIYGFFTKPLTTGIILVSSLSIIYFLDVLFNLFLVIKSLSSPSELNFSDPELKIPANKLPLYTILCPLYKESAVLPHFIKSIQNLDWPKSKLEVLLLLEEDDSSTQQAAAALNLPSYIRIVVVPHSYPKTKPKACNYGLALARGECIVIYDAEDRPDPLQLKKAYLGFQSSPANVVCLQAKLNYYNPHHNLLTRLFTAEYSLWFDLILPGLQSLNTTIPLGGTSNHFKTAILRQLHGWDAFNVTEDCDLGARLFKNGYRTSIIDSVTLEEANSKVGNWLRQRSRWIKGYIQTFLVHNRHPVQFFRRHGIHALIFQLVVGGKIAFMVINPLLWLATFSYFAFYSLVGPTIESLYPPVIFYMAAISLVFGNFLVLFYYMIGAAKREQWSIMKYIYLIPVYWFMVSIAAGKAFIQLVFKPHYWEKTHHGLHLPADLTTTSPLLRPAVNFKKLPLRFAPAAALVVSSVAVNFFNFLYNAFLGRSVSAADFGLVSLIGSFIYLVNVPIGSVSETLTYRTAYLKGKFGSVTPALHHYFHAKALLIGLLMAIIWIIISPQLTHFFNSSNLVAFLSFAPAIVISLLVAVKGGILGGELKFGILALAAFSEAVIKFLLAFILVRLGWSDYVYISIPLSMLLPLFIYSLTLRSSKATSAPVDNHLLQYFPRDFFFTNILTGLYGAAFFTVDIILAKCFLSPSDAGIYALISLVGKTVYFIGRLLAQFITPLVSHADGRGTDSIHAFRLIILFSMAFSLVGFLGFGLLAPITGPLIFGAKILPALPYIAIYCAGMVLFATSTLIVNYHQAKRHYEFPVSSIFITLLQVIILTFFHSSLRTFVWAMFFVASLNLAIILALHIFYRELKIILSNFVDFLDLFAVWKNGTTPLPDDKLRILIFNWRDMRHKWAGGAEVYVHELAKRWVAAGHRVTVFCGNDGKSPRNEVIDGVKIVRRGGFFSVYIWSWVYYLFRLRSRCDVIIDSENGVPFYTPLISKKPVILLIHHVHQEYLRRHAPPVLSHIARFMEKQLMPLVYRSSQIVTVSQSSRQDLINVLDFPPNQIEIVNPGIDINQFHANRKSAYPLFLYLGRIRPYKNVDIAIKAFSKVVKKHPTSRFIIAGWGECLPELKKLVSDLKIQHQVEFKERVTEAEKVQLLQSSWIAIQPSSFEGWGITVIEANACGTPVIASNVTGLRDSVQHNHTGILVPGHNQTALASEISRLLTHRQELKRLSANALAWSAAFDWDDKAMSFLHIIQNHINKVHRSPLPNVLIFNYDQNT